MTDKFIEWYSQGITSNIRWDVNVKDGEVYLDHNGLAHFSIKTFSDYTKWLRSNPLLMALT